jgi:3-oxoacyl-[acyl-carrier protein] reductase
MPYSDNINEKDSTHPTALITGASRGIGAATAEAFARAGYNLILTCDKTFEALSILSKRLESDFSVSCIPLIADMGDIKAVEEVFSHMRQTHDTLDVLVNNAGISYIGLLSDMSPEEWNRIISVNLSSCFYTCKYAVPMMLKKHSGRIINISSVWGSCGASMEVAYSASKGGVNSFTKALAKELAPSNIQVNAIACGLIDTEMNSCLSPEDIEKLCAEIPADRIGKPEEVAELILRAASAPGYMTGQIITIDGGWC